MQALYQIIILMTINYGGKKIFKLEGKKDATLIKNTIVFNAFVFCQVCSCAALLSNLIPRALNFLSNYPLQT